MKTPEEMDNNGAYYHILVVALIVVVIYIVALIGKNVSYAIWYEDLVIETIKNTVRHEALRDE